MEHLSTPRLLLEPITVEDLDDLHALNSEPLTMKFLDGTRTREATAAEIGRIVAAAAVRGCGGWAVRLRADRRFVGRCGIKTQPEGTDLELLYAITESSRGFGYATEAASAVLHRTIALGISHVIACAAPANVASIAVMRRIGMVFDRHAQMYGEDMVVYRSA